MAVYNSIETDGRVIRSAEALYGRGYSVTIISCNSDDNYSNPAFKNINFKSPLKGMRLLLSFYSFVLKYARKHQGVYSILYLHDYYLPLLGKIIRNFNKIPWVYDAHELLINKKSYRYSFREKLFLFLERISIRNADLVVAANQERERIIRKIYGLKNTVPVLNIAKVGIRKKESPKVTIIYQGAMTAERKIENFIEAMKYLPENINLKLIGGGDVERYKKIAKEWGLDNRIRFTGKIPYEELLRECAVGKVGFVSYKTSDLNTHYCSPNKLYEYAQIGIPMIMTPQPFLARIAQEYHIGEIWDENRESIEDLAKKIMKILAEYDSYTENLSSFNADYNQENEMKKLSDAVERLN